MNVSENIQERVHERVPNNQHSALKIYKQLKNISTETFFMKRDKKRDTYYDILKSAEQQFWDRKISKKSSTMSCWLKFVHTRVLQPPVPVFFLQQCPLALTILKMQITLPPLGRVIQMIQLQHSQTYPTVTLAGDSMTAPHSINQQNSWKRCHDEKCYQKALPWNKFTDESFQQVRWAAMKKVYTMGRLIKVCEC